jgi:ribosome maturation factor RimP
MSSIIDSVAELITPLLAEQSLELVDVEYKKEGSRWYLRIFIDKPGGVQLADCEKASNIISTELDKHDKIPHHYYLEVSSPGIERPLRKPKDFLRFRGSEVIVYTISKIDGSKKFQGIVVDFVDNQLIMKTAKGQIEIPFDLISKANLKVF